MDERFEHFKEECRNFELYLNERNRLKEQLERIQYRIDGVHSTDFETTYKRISRTEKNILPEIEVKKKLLEKYEENESRIRWITDVFGRIPFTSYRVFAWQIYILGMSYSELAGKYSFNGESMRKNIITVLNECLD